MLDVGRVAGRALFGERGALVMAGLVAIAMLLAVAALTMTGPRVYEAMGADYPRLGAWLERGRSRSRGPVAAIALQAGIACVLIASASFEALITYAGCMLSVSSALKASSLNVSPSPDGNSGRGSSLRSAGTSMIGGGSCDS